MNQITTALVLLLVVAALPQPSTAGTSCGDHTEAESIECTISCDKGDNLSVSVSADDQSFGVARAWGSLVCGDGSAQCNGEGSCSASDKTWSADSNGKCKAGTEELFHDGFSWTCKASGMGDVSDRGVICSIIHIDPYCDPAQAVTSMAKQLIAYVTGTDVTGIAQNAVEDAVAKATGSVGLVPCPWTSMKTPDNVENPDPNLVLSRICPIPVVGQQPANAPASAPGEVVTSEVRGVVKDGAALARICRWDAGCWYVIPACEHNEAGFIRACAVTPESPRIVPDETLKTRFGL